MNPDSKKENDSKISEFERLKDSTFLNNLVGDLKDLLENPFQENPLEERDDKP